MQDKIAVFKNLDAVPTGALRILSRHAGTEVLIVHGDERAVELGEEIAYEEVFPSIAVAESVSHFCSAMLLICRPPDPEGWHGFPVDGLPTLVRQARNQLNVTYFPEATARERQAWTAQRNARLAFLAGQGWTAKMIAADPLVRSTPGMVYRQAHKLEVYLSDAPQGQIQLRLPVGELAIFDRAARAARLTRDGFLRSFLIRAAATL